MMEEQFRALITAIIFSSSNGYSLTESKEKAEAILRACFVTSTKTK